MGVRFGANCAPNREIAIFAAYGYGKGSVICQGDFEIINKAYDFTRHCITSDWVLMNGEVFDESMTLTDPAAVREYFVSTFSDKELELLEYQLRSKKGSDDPQRERLIRAAGYKVGDKLTLTEKFPG